MDQKAKEEEEEEVAREEGKEIIQVVLLPSMDVTNGNVYRDFTEFNAVVLLHCCLYL